MSKKLCKLVSDGFLDDHTKKYTQLVNNPKYVCMKCGRVANDEDSLCRPKKMKDKKESKKSDGFAQIADDMATEKMTAEIDRKVIEKVGKKRIVKVSKQELRSKPIQEAESLEKIEIQSLDDETNYDENLPNED